MVKNKTASLPQSEFTTQGSTVTQHFFFLSISLNNVVDSVFDELHFTEVIVRTIIFCFSYRFHSERQPSSVCDPCLQLSSRRVPEREERQLTSIMHAVGKLPKQRQVINQTGFMVLCIMLWC